MVGSLPENAPPPCGAAPPYVSTMIFRPVRPVSPIGPPITNLPVGLTYRKSFEPTPRRVVEVAIVAVEDRLDDVLEQVRLDQGLRVEAVAVLGRDEDALDLDGALDPVLVDLVAHGDLRLPVRAQVRQHVRLADLREPPRELVREHDRERHQLLRLVARVPEHHPLVAGADPVDRVHVAVLGLVRLVDALRDVRRLPVDRDHHAAGLGVEPVLGARVADVLDRVADDRANVDVRLRRDLARDDDEPRGDERLAGDAPVHVVLQDGVEDGVGDLVGDLVGVPLRHRLRRELERAGRHRGGV